MRLETRFWRTWLVLQVCSLSAASAKSGDLMTSSAQIHRQHRARLVQVSLNKIKKIYKFAFHVNQVYCADFKIIRQKNKIIISTILWVEASNGFRP